MSEPKGPLCDVCGAVKGETNHWFRAFSTQCVVAFSTPDPQDPPTKYSDICGEACVHKFLSEWFSSRKSHEGAPVSTGK